MGVQFQPNEFTRLLEMELPSSQTPVQSNTPASSATSGDDYVNYPLPTSNTEADDYVLEPLFPGKSSGLLDDMLKESQTISRNGNRSSNGSEMAASSNKGKDLMDDFIVDATTSDIENFYGESNETEPLNQFDDSSSAHSSIGEF